MRMSVYRLPILSRTPRLSRKTTSISRTSIRNINKMAEQTNSTGTTTEPVEAVKKPELPKLSVKDFQTYNHMAEGMTYYHNHFRQQWTVLYKACETQTRPPRTSIRQFLTIGLQFCSQLTMHHDIEEAHIFPILARKMPAFQEELEMKSHHKAIHAGLVKMQKYLEDCREGERELRLVELKEVMDVFREVLWKHLDAEVKQLEAENMRGFWTLEEMRRMPM